MRAAIHVGSLINIIALVKSPFILDTAIEKQVIATADHLIEALKITQEIINGNLVGIPKDKIDFLKEIFLPVFNTQEGPKRDDKTGKKERYRAVTTGELSDYYRKVKHASISTTSIQRTYLAELIAGNLINEEKSAIHSNYNIYRPTFDLDDPNSYNNRFNQSATKKTIRFILFEWIDNLHNSNSGRSLQQF